MKSFVVKNDILVFFMIVKQLVGLGKILWDSSNFNEVLIQISIHNFNFNGFCNFSNVSSLSKNKTSKNNRNEQTSFNPRNIFTVICFPIIDLSKCFCCFLLWAGWVYVFSSLLLMLILNQMNNRNHLLWSYVMDTNRYRCDFNII